MEGRFCSYSDGVCVGSRLQHASCGPCGLQWSCVQAHCSVGDQFAACHPAEAATWGFGQGCLVPVNIAHLGFSGGTEFAELMKFHVLVFFIFLVIRTKKAQLCRLLAVPAGCESVA